ncbi:RINT1-like protein [Nymphaea thermarum]|nr:RINT1-like protein [Nymphaea thermarum]
MAGEPTEILCAFQISPFLSSFFRNNFSCRDDLAKSRSIAAELQQRCLELDHDIAGLDERISAVILSYASLSERIDKVIGGIRAELADLCSSPSLSSGISGGRGRDLKSSQQLLSEELPSLAKEVTRVETVRAYAETALRLDSLVGDIEDRVSFCMTVNLQKPFHGNKSEDVQLLAIKSVANAEDILTSTIKLRPQWTHLVSAVDCRIDRALAVLIPQVIADHRALLTSLGWPPSLTSTDFVNQELERKSKLSNPLFLMQGEIKSHYCGNFLSMCYLQELQMQRRARQLVGCKRESALHQPLWAIEELVNSLVLTLERYFSNWVNKPEFIFALTYRIARDFVESMDDVLQPLVDMAKLKGYSCREEWISAMILSLVTFLEKEVFPVYLKCFKDIEVSGAAVHARVSWLHLVDLMVDFDKRMQSLVTSTGLLLTVREDEVLRRISSMSVFCDRPDWLEIWAEIEAKDVLDKLTLEFENEESWKMLIQGDKTAVASENCRGPIIAGSVLRCLSTLIERCRPPPSTYLRERFVLVTCSRVLMQFMNCLLRRCQEAEGLTALTDEDAMIRVVNSVNAARYCEMVLQGWSEDAFLLEMSCDEYDILTSSKNGFFGEEVEQLKGFRIKWAGKLSTVVLRGFDAHFGDYVKNKRQWQEAKGDVLSVSPAFIDALDYLQGKIVNLGGSLNDMDFADVWRSLAGGLDHLIFNGILMANLKFSDGGVERFGVDFEVLLRIFRPWCLRPQGFFPRLTEGLCVLNLGEGVGREFMGSEDKGKWLKRHGIRHLSVTQVDKLIKMRIYGV